MRKINILIVHYNTPKLTECLIKSINKYVGANCTIYIFDNSDKEPFTYRQDNIVVFDNTQGQIINFEEWLERFPQRFQTKAKMNNFGSAKHAYTIEKCFDLLNVDDFVLMDSDILLKQNISNFVNNSYTSCGEILRTNIAKSRILPFLCYINVKKCKNYGIHFFDENRMNGLYSGEYAESYDTGSSFLEDIIETKSSFLNINLEEYIEHFKAGSWLSESNILHKTQRSEDAWLEKNRKYYINTNIIVSLTTHGERVKYIQSTLKSLLKQTVKPYKIVVSLSDDDYSNMPSDTIIFMKEKNIEVITCKKDLGPHTKYYFVMQKYRENPIVTVDDDIIYDNNLLELLLEGYSKYPHCISANRVHKIRYKCDGIPFEYAKWQYQYKNEYMKPSFDLFATGVGGVLYPPNILEIDGVLKEDIDKSFFADDIYLKWRENELGIRVVYTGNGKKLNGAEIENDVVKAAGLALINNLQNRNDLYIKQIGLKRIISSYNKRVIYTCITGNYEKLCNPTITNDNFDYVCFTDNQNLVSDFWNLRLIPEELQSLTKVKQQRIIKICPHKYLPEYEESIWIDGAVDVLNDVSNFIQAYCNEKDKSVFIRRHPERKCIYIEGNTCIEMKKDKPEIINTQLTKYKNEGFPSNFGLAETNIIYRKHNDPYCIRLMNMWANELLSGSHRDQLSFNYCLWKIGDSGFKYLDTNLLKGVYFKWYSRHDRGEKTETNKQEKTKTTVQEKKLITNETGKTPITHVSVYLSTREKGKKKVIRKSGTTAFKKSR